MTGGWIRGWNPSLPDAQNELKELPQTRTNWKIDHNHVEH